MKKVFVTLVSEQAIPNVQYIKEFSPFDFYVFISTPKMEKNRKIEALLSACNIPEETTKRLVVNEDKLSDILAKLKEEFSDSNRYQQANFVLNCTLGTKIMSIALYDFFKESFKEQSEFLYTPIHTNEYANMLTDEVNSFKSQIILKEYLASYGISIKKTSEALKSEEESNDFFEKFLNFDASDFTVLEQLREYKLAGKEKPVKGREKGVASITCIPHLPEFLIKHEFKSNKPEALSKDEVKYLTGGWFEEWAFWKFKKDFSIEPDFIGLGLEVQNYADNDLDVAFIYNNDIYIIECKTTMPKDLQQITIYKSGGLLEKFGRAAKSFIFTLSDLREKDGRLKEAIENRAKQQNIKVLDRKDLTEMTDFKKILEKK
jgi:hypothetical protein